MSKSKIQMLKLSGNNKCSQLGEKSNSRSLSGNAAIYPSINSHLDPSSIASFSTYWYHTVVITNSGDAYASGDNSECQIIGSLPKRKLNKFTKFDIKDKDGHVWYPISAVCGSNYTLYLLSYSKNSDRISLAYSNQFIQTDYPLFLSTGTNIPVSLFGGYSNSAAIDSEGKIIFIPESVLEPPSSQIDAICLPDSEKAVSIACCNDFLLALGSSGRVFIAKTDDDEEEDFDESTGLKFSVVKSLDELKLKFVDVCGTSFHCFAISEDGRVFGRGSNEGGQLGVNQQISDFDEFVEVKTLSQYKITAAYASDHSLFQTEGGKVLACGRNLCGELIGIKPSKTRFFSPCDTGIDRGATLCIAGWEMSAVFIGCEPLRNPNRRIKTDKVENKTDKTTSNPEEKEENEKDKTTSNSNQKEKVENETDKTTSNPEEKVENETDKTTSNPDQEKVENETDKTTSNPDQEKVGNETDKTTSNPDQEKVGNETDKTTTKQAPEEKIDKV